MQRPKRPARYHHNLHADYWEDGEPTRPVALQDLSLQARSLQRRDLMSRRRNGRMYPRESGWNQREGGFSGGELQAQFYNSSDQQPPPRPAPPVPSPHDSLPPTSFEPNDVMGRLLSVLECPVCFEYVSPPILQCMEGHLVCSKCRERLNVCPKCRQPFADIRARALEQVAEVVPYPCYNSGCDMMFALAERYAHESTCPFRQYQCPIEHCAWVGIKSLLPDHMSHHHPSNLISTSEHIISLNLIQHVHEEKSFVMHCHGEIFQCVMGVDCRQDIFVGLVMYLGSKDKAKDFEFEMKFERDTPPYTSVIIRRVVSEETPAGTQLSGTSAMVISFSTLSEVIQDINSRAPILDVNLSISRRIKEPAPSTSTTPIDDGNTQ